MTWVEFKLFPTLRALVLLFVLSTCLGCYTKTVLDSLMGAGVDNSEPPSELVDFNETTQLNKVWSKNVGKGTDELFIKLVPAILDDKIYIADTRGNITALYADTGADVWQVDSDLSITGGPGADDNLVMLGTDEGEVLSLLAESGEELWRSKVSSEILSSPKESDDVVVIRTIDGKIFALDATTGDRLWVYDRTVPALTLRGTSTPIIANGLVIAGFDGGRVTALQLKSGKLIWEKKVAVSRGRSELERMVDIDAQPLVVGDVIYVTTFQANVTALSLESGQILWERDISSHTELGADTNNLYITDDIGNVWALDRFSGASIWKQEKLIHRKVTGPAVLGERVIVGDLEGYLHWLDKTTGEISARTQIDDTPILTQPITSNNILFAYSSGGTLSAHTYFGIEPKEIVTESVEEIEEPAAETIETEAESAVEVAEESEPTEEKKSLWRSFLDSFTDDPTDDPEQDEE